MCKSKGLTKPEGEVKAILLRGLVPRGIAGSQIPASDARVRVYRRADVSL